MPKTTKNDRDSEGLEDIGLALEWLERQSWGSTGDVQLTGMSIRLGGDCLLTLRAVIAREKQVVAFVGATTIGNAIIKAKQLMGNEALEWKEDRWARAVAQNGGVG